MKNSYGWHRLVCAVLSTTCVGRNSFDNQITYPIENIFICRARGFGAFDGYFKIGTYPTIAVAGTGSELMFY